jgi:hypothetical protein
MSHHRIAMFVSALALTGAIPATAAASEPFVSSSPSPGSSVCSEVCSGGPAGDSSTLPIAGTPTRPAVVRVNAGDGGFHWRDAGIGAGAIVLLTMIGLGGTYTATVRRHAGGTAQPSS